MAQPRHPALRPLHSRAGVGGLADPLTAFDGAAEDRADRTDRAESIVAIYQLEHLALFRYIRDTAGSEVVAEDILQETFLRLIREVAAGRLPLNVHAWLYRVATNLVVSQGRRRRTAERHLPVLVERDPVSISPEQRVLAEERDAAMLDALLSLPVDARLALLLAAQGFPGRAIAHALGRSEGAARTLLCRARLRLRARFASYDTSLSESVVEAG